MDKKISKKRLAKKEREIRELIAKFAKAAFGESFGDEDPCATEQAAYDAAVTTAATLLIEWEDKQAEASTAESAYNIGFMTAMAAYTVLQNCRNA